MNVDALDRYCPGGGRTCGPDAWYNSREMPSGSLK